MVNFYDAQFDETEKQNIKDKTSLEEQERVKELESLRQRHAEVVDEIDQVFVRTERYILLSKLQ